MPDKIHKATEVSRQVGELELTPSPTVTAKEIRIDDMAAAAKPPAMMAVHCSDQPSSPVDRVSSIVCGAAAMTGCSMLIGGRPTASRKTKGLPLRRQSDQPDRSIRPYRSPPDR